ncbi:MAG TPA: hypothetical protein VFI45_02970 [Candidatus Acidoferrum sp.]|nr:hypothetical protein [Candidatus Acidoferrum sp.]
MRFNLLVSSMLATGIAPIPQNSGSLSHNPPPARAPANADRIRAIGHSTNTSRLTA